MPTGLLLPAEAGPSEPAEALGDRLRTSRTSRPGWLEVAAEGNARAEPLWISVTTLALAQNAFARAQPNFGPFGERIVQPDNVKKLAAELRAFRAEWMAVPTAADAKAKWPGADALHDVTTDEAWRTAQATFATTLEELAARADVIAAQGGGMRIGPR